MDEFLEVSLTGHALLDNPLLNKGTVFPEDERREFGLLGLLPPYIATEQEQLARTYGNYKMQDSDIERYIFLASTHDRNETCSTAWCRSTSPNLKSMPGYGLPDMYAIGERSRSLQVRDLQPNCLCKGTFDNLFSRN